MFFVENWICCVEIFANGNEFVKTYKAEELHVIVVFVTIENYLAMLAKHFKKYFFLLTTT